jgi:hypothetical protein
LPSSISINITYLTLLVHVNQFLANTAFNALFPDSFRHHVNNSSFPYPFINYSEMSPTTWLEDMTVDPSALDFRLPSGRDE